MQNSSLFQLVQSFSPVERRDARKFLSSPFFNTRQDVLLLFDFLTAAETPTKEQAWNHLLPGADFDDQKLRLLMSYLHRLLEQYVSVSEMGEDGLHGQLYLAAGYRRRGLSVPFEKSLKTLDKSLSEQPKRDASFHYLHFRLNWERYQTATSDNPSGALPIRQMEASVDAFYLSTRLRLLCHVWAQQGVYRTEDAAENSAETLLALAAQPHWLAVPAVAIYLHCYQMLAQPEVEAHFQVFKEKVLAAGSLFETNEIRELYLLAINYCIRRLNDGEKRYFKEVLDLYKAGLEHGFLIENGMLSRFTYHNIVAAGLHTGELDWVNFFIHEYKNALKRTYRESSFSFNLARLEYARQRYGAVLELLQKANYRDPLLNLAAKTLLLKTFYEMGEHDLLQSHLDAMRNYILRKRVIGYHRTNYLNIVRYSGKLLKTNFMSQQDLDSLRSEIAQEEVLTEREWLLVQAGLRL